MTLQLFRRYVWSPGVGAGSTSSSSAWATNARCAVGHDTPWLVATSVTERAASPIAAPIWLRNRLVVRARAGIWAMDSVNEPRSQWSSRHRHRVLWLFRI